MHRCGAIVVGLVSAVTGTAGICCADPIAEELLPGVVRYFASAGAQAGAEQSVALVASLEGIPVAGSFVGVVPVFTEGVGEWAVSVPVDPGTSLYGTGMVTGPLERSGRFVEVYAQDAFAYGEQSTRLYQAHPWIMGVRADGSSFGVVFDSTWRSTIDTTDPLGRGIVFTTDGPAPPVIVIERDHPREVVRTLAALTGAPALLPRWAIGFHQSRYQYEPQQEVEDIATGFRIREIPADAIHVDIEYMDGYRVFTFDAAKFPDPAGMDARLAAMGFRTVWNVSPTVKVEPGNPLWEWGSSNNWFVKAADGVTDFVAQGWPGDSVWVDYTNTAARLWFASLYSAMANVGADGIWTDVNEPTVFEARPDYGMPEGNVHLADPALGGPGPHLKYRNIYGMQSARAAFEGLYFANPAARPFVLTRSNYLGGQRYAATWTGDNTSTWYHLGLSIPMTLTLGLSGQPYSGPDIGGFALEATPDLYARWIGIGALLPFARGHSLFAESEPWSYGGDAEYTARLAIARRYRLLPYLDTLFFDAHATGTPIAQPLFFADPSDPALRTVQDVFLLGDSIVVSAAVSEDGSPPPPPLGEDLRPLGFPISADTAADLDTTHPDLPRLYLRPGHIVPTGPLMQHSGERPLDELTLVVALNDEGFARGELFEDAGDGWGALGTEFRRSVYEAHREGDIVRVEVVAVSGSRAAIARPVHVRVLGDDGIERRASGEDGDAIEIDLAAPVASFPVDDDAVDGRRIDARFSGEDAAAIASDAPPAAGLLRVHARADADALRMGIAAQARIDNAALIVLLDTQNGGPTALAHGFEGEPAALHALAGAVFDPGLTPDAALVVDTTGGGLWTFLVRFASDGSAVSSEFLGRGVAGEHSGELRHGMNPSGVRLALDHGASAGSPVPGQPVPDAGRLGYEIELPWAALSMGEQPVDAIRSAVFHVQRSPASLDHMLPDDEIAMFPLPSGPDFAALSGAQFFTIASTPACPGDITGDGATNAADFVVLAGNFGAGPDATRAQGDLDGNGLVNASDFVALAGAYGCEVVRAVGRR